MKRIGEMIRDFREARGWTATELARRAGLGDCLISSYEKGTTYPSLMSFIALADAFGLPMDDLAGRIVKEERQDEPD